MRTNPWERCWQGTAIVLVFVLFPQLCIAQTNEPSRKGLTLGDAVEYALQHYPAVRASLEQVSAARGGVTLARTQYLPQLNGVYQDSRATQNQVPGIWLPTPITPTVEGPIGPTSGQSYWGSQAAALFSWEPLDFGLRAAKVGQARTAEEKSQADQALTQLQVATAVGNYFLRAVTNQQVAWLLRPTLIAGRCSINPSMFSLRTNCGQERTLLARMPNLREQRLSITRHSKQNARRSILLRRLWERRGRRSKWMEAAWWTCRRPGSLLETSASDHPLARDQMASVRQIQAQEKILQRSDYPRLFLQAEAFGRGSEVPNNGSIIGNWNGAAPARGNWLTGVTILFPDVFAFKARSAEEQISKANERSQQAHYDQTIQDLTGQIRAAHDQLKAVELVAQETPIELAAARQSEAQSRARYQSGLATLVEVADAENLLAQAEMDDSIARLNVWRGLFAVAYAQGDLKTFLQALHGATPRGQ